MRLTKWQSQDYVETKQQLFEILDKYIQPAPNNIMDIGCGLAHESIQFNKKYGTELLLLESNPSTGIKGSWSNSSNDFAFYNSLTDLKKYFDSIQLNNYKLEDIKHYTSNKKFDVICSFLSCGFHYPIDTYKKFIKKHMHKNTKLIFDLRKKITNHNCKIKHVIFENAKYIKAEIEI